MGYQIEKLHLGKDSVSIEYTNQGASGKDYFTLKCKDAPLPSLPQALNSLKADVLEICALPDWYGKDMEVRGVSFTHADDTLGAVISAVKKVETSNSPFNINTPILFESADPEKPGLSEECFKRLKKVMEEANRYILGERAQGDLFKGKKAEAQKN